MRLACELCRGKLQSKLAQCDAVTGNHAGSNLHAHPDPDLSIFSDRQSAALTANAQLVAVKSVTVWHAMVKLQNPDHGPCAVFWPGSQGWSPRGYWLSHSVCCLWLLLHTEAPSGMYGSQCRCGLSCSFHSVRSRHCCIARLAVDCKAGTASPVLLHNLCVGLTLEKYSCSTICCSSRPLEAYASIT